MPREVHTSVRTFSALADVEDAAAGPSAIAENEMPHEDNSDAHQHTYKDNVQSGVDQSVDAGPKQQHVEGAVSLSALFSALDASQLSPYQLSVWLDQVARFSIAVSHGRAQNAQLMSALTQLCEARLGEFSAADVSTCLRALAVYDSEHKFIPEAFARLWQLWQQQFPVEVGPVSGVLYALATHGMTQKDHSVFEHVATRLESGIIQLSEEDEPLVHIELLYGLARSGAPPQDFCI